MAHKKVQVVQKMDVILTQKDLGLRGLGDKLLKQEIY